MIYDQSIFRAYDIRGIYPSQMNEKVAYAAGQAFVKVMNAKTVVIGRDVRDSGVALKEAAILGITDAGASVIDIGVISTEMLYFAAATLECDGGMSLTASHNPSQWNGMKMIGPKAVPLTKEEKLGEIYEFINSNHKIAEYSKGSVRKTDVLPAYLEYLKQFVPTFLPSTKIVINTNFGANGPIVDGLVKELPLDIIRLNWERDGSFPKGTPDPLLPSNRKELCEKIVEEKAEFGVAFDADADRAFFYDEKGRFFHGYYITALLISHFFSQKPDQKAIIERRLIWANQDAAKNNQGQTIFSRTGHGYIKKAMRDQEAIFGGESSGHYYYKDFFFCDNGLISFLLVLDTFAKQISSGKKVSDLLDYYMTSYPISIEEMNYITDRAKEIIDQAAKKFEDAKQDHEDGLTVDYPDWHFSLRTSSNEPVLRFNTEAKTQEHLDQKKAEMMDYIESFGAKLRDDN